MFFALQSALIEKFATAYQQRLSDRPVERIDPAIRRSLAILEEAVTTQLRALPRPSDKTIDHWLDPYRTAIGAKEPDPTDYARLYARVHRLKDFTFMEINMGSATRLSVRTAAGEPLQVPDEFAYQTPWSPTVFEISRNLLLVSEDSIQDAGMRVGARLVLLRVNGRIARKVGQFTCESTLDLAPFEPKGNQIRVLAVERPKAFMVSSADPTLGVRYDFACEPEGLRLVSRTYTQPAFRAVDQAIAAAWKTPHPTKLQQQIRAAFKPGQPIDDTLRQSKGARGETIVSVGSWIFTVSASGKVLRVIKQ